jgi:hypothetical protein
MEGKRGRCRVGDLEKALIAELLPDGIQEDGTG